MYTHVYPVDIFSTIKFVFLLETLDSYLETQFLFCPRTRCF